ncbi:hypothetical protein ACHRVZ_01505 [Flavobacterium sp. FlaQc-57]
MQVKKKTTSVAAEMVKLKEIVHLYKESDNGVIPFSSRLIY